MTYDVRDLTPGGHNLIASEIAVNSTFGGNPVVDCPECCSGWSSVFFGPSSLDLIDGNTDTVAIDGINSCSGDPGVLTPDLSSWGSNNVVYSDSFIWTTLRASSSTSPRNSEEN